MIVTFYIQGQKVDLSETATITLTSAVANIQDITKNVTDFTKDFTLPASANNNKIFKHYYNFSIDNGFDARTKVNAEIKIDGNTFKIGKARLNKATIKSGLPSTYNVNFWGDLLSLPKKLSDYKLSDLDLSSYDHAYNSISVKLGLSSELFNGDVKYCLFPKKQYYYNSNTSDNTITDSLANIAYQEGIGINGVQWNELRPSIKLITIIEAIENDFGLTFSRDYFGRSEFDNLYLWLNNTDEQNAGGDTQIVDFDSGSSENINLTTNKGTFTVSNTSASNDNVTYNLSLTITPKATVIPNIGYENVPYTIKFYKNGELDKTTNVTKGTKTVKYTLSTSGTGEEEFTHTVYYEISTSEEFKYTAELKQEHLSTGFPFILDTLYTYASENLIESELVVSEEIPDIKIIDFLKGLFKFAKLVVIPNGENSLYINTIKDYYNEGNVYDITKHVDNSEYIVERGKMYNELSFGFKESSTILAAQYNKNESREYGTEETNIYDESGVELIDGDEFEVKLPFEQVIYERLIDLEGNEDTNIMYAAIVDNKVSPTNIKPHIHYISNVSVSAKPIGIIDEDGGKYSLNTTLNIPSHTQALTDSLYSTIFSQEYSEWDGSLISNTLYTNYYKDYIDSIFNSKKREIQYKCFLDTNILLKLQLNDVLKINNNYFRIDKYKLNLTTKETTLNLINTFVKINSFSADNTDIYVDSSAQTVSQYVTNSSDTTLLKVDRGSGVSWVNSYVSNSSIFFEFEENTSDLVRDMIIELTDNNTGKVISFYLNQTNIEENGKLNFSNPSSTVLYNTLFTGKN